MNKRTQKKLLKAMRDKFISRFSAGLTENEKLVTEAMLCDCGVRNPHYYYYFTTMAISNHERGKPCFKVSEVYVSTRTQSRFHYNRYFPCTLKNYDKILSSAVHFNLEHYNFIQNNKMIKHSERRAFSE